MSDAVFKAIQGYKNATDASIKDNQNFQISALTAGNNRNPIDRCRYPIGDVTYPEFHNAKIDVLGLTDAQSAGTAHTHTLSLANDAYASTTHWDFDFDESRGGLIGITNTTAMDTVGFLGVNVNGTALSDIFVEVFLVNADGSSTRVVSVDVSSQFTTGITYIEEIIPPLVVQAGARYIVRVRNSCTVPSAEIGVVSVRIPAGMVNTSFVTVVGATDKTSYTAAEMATAGAAGEPTCIWALLASQNIAATDQSFSDDFNRGLIGGLWHLISSGSDDLGIVDNAAAYTGAATGHQNALYLRPTADDKMLVQGDLHDIDDRLGLQLCCKSDLSQVVYLGVTRTGAGIYTGPYTSLTLRASITGTFTDSHWSLQFDPTTGLYLALQDGNDVGLFWTDEAGAMQHGPDYRYGGLRIENSSGSAGNIDNWTLKDWV